MSARLFLVVWLALATTVGASQPPRLSIHSEGERAIVRLAQPGVAPLAGTRYRLELQSSPDLRHWAVEGDWETLRDRFDPVGLGGVAQRFYRLVGQVVDEGTEDGAAVFGYQAVFEEELARQGFLTPETFAVSLPELGYRTALSFEATTARYWEEFNTDPAVANEGITRTDPGYRLYDFRLNEAERALFVKNGFVVSERLGSTSFGEVYYRIFSDDLPVFITADSVLHAWHYSYQRLLEEMEELQLAPALEAVLEAMRSGLRSLPSAVMDGPLAASVTDADYFVAVALSLLRGAPEATVLGGSAENGRVAATLDAVAAQEYLPSFELFGERRPFDFSQFTVRGHYERSPLLGRYFKAVIWCGRADLRVFCPTGVPTAASLRSLGTAAVLTKLIGAVGLPLMEPMDRVIRLFVGRQDSMNCQQMAGLLGAAGLETWEQLSQPEALAGLHQQVAQGRLGGQLYAGDVLVSGFGDRPGQLPRAFAFYGQRFAPDGWAISQVTFDRVVWSEEIPGKTFVRRVLRRRTSALDVAWAVFGNRQVGDLIAGRMLAEDGEQFRDGLPYAHNLEAVAGTFRRLTPAAWDDSLYTRWLHALRALSGPTTDERFPEAMRTRAWAMRMLNTQLGSYTQLKHDTVLYAKQPYASIIVCEYPAGFVEPVPAFWWRMAEMADAAADGMGGLPASGIHEFRHPDQPQEPPIPISRAERLAARVAHCRSFAARMRKLAVMAEKELRQEPFTEEEIDFIRGLMNRIDDEYYGARYDGWYPYLFYKDYGQVLDAGMAGGPDTQPCNRRDRLVTDIFTAPPDGMDPEGGVLHQGVGDVDLLLIAIDSGPDRMVYAGPTMSHYEFTLKGVQRLTNSAWNPDRYPRPGWTHGYLVPRSRAEP